MPRKIHTIDAETDPFKRGRIPKPFIWGHFDGVKYTYYRDLADLIEVLKDLRVVVYAHNGGKFDYHYMFDYLAPFDDILIINGRIAKFKIGLCEFRDSFNILPIALRNYKKDDFDYTILEAAVREHPENWQKIVEYLGNDCRYLHELVTEFQARYGAGLTQAGTAMKVWQKMSGRQAPKSTPEFYALFDPYYYGGRVQCFKGGIIEADFKVIDINSAYPYAMHSRHPISIDYDEFTHDIDHDSEDYGACFFTVTCISEGVFPFRNENHALTFPNDGLIRTYFVTGWELIAARETGTIHQVKVNHCYRFFELTDFTEYIDKFYNERLQAKAEGDKAGDIFAKLLMNSLYGKFGANPDNYEKFTILDHSIVPELDNDQYRFAGELGKWALMAEDLPDDDKRYYNVATSASITGYVRAYLFKALHSCGMDNVLYCDTDSIATSHIGDAIHLGSKLGQWKDEGDFTRAGIGGKKLYIFEGKPNKDGEREYKTASKGARLTHNQLWKIAQGETVIYSPENPTYSVHSGIKFIDRKIQSTF